VFELVVVVVVVVVIIARFSAAPCSIYPSLDIIKITKAIMMMMMMMMMC
jgi:hypothetical protein